MKDACIIELHVILLCSATFIRKLANSNWNAKQFLTYEGVVIAAFFQKGKHLLAASSTCSGRCKK